MNADTQFTLSLSAFYLVWGAICTVRLFWLHPVLILHPQQTSLETCSDMPKSVYPKWV